MTLPTPTAEPTDREGKGAKYWVRECGVFFHLEGPTLPLGGLAFEYKLPAQEWAARLNDAYAAGSAAGGGPREAAQAALQLLETIGPTEVNGFWSGDKFIDRDTVKADLRSNLAASGRGEA